jgi:hypothetical protein
MTKIELYHIVEALEGAKAELEEMQQSEDWFVSDSLEQIEIALEILRELG